MYDTALLSISFLLGVVVGVCLFALVALGKRNYYVIE